MTYLSFISTIGLDVTEINTCDYRETNINAYEAYEAQNYWNQFLCAYCEMASITLWRLVWWVLAEKHTSVRKMKNGWRTVYPFASRHICIRAQLSIWKTVSPLVGLLLQVLLSKIVLMSDRTGAMPSWWILACQSTSAYTEAGLFLKLRLNFPKTF